MNGIDKRGGIVKRILLIIDVLAPIRHGIALTEITERINDACGLRVSTRTVHRDLMALKEIGYVTCDVHGKRKHRWKLNLRRTECVQAVAVDLLEVA